MEIIFDVMPIEVVSPIYTAVEQYEKNGTISATAFGRLFKQNQTQISKGEGMSDTEDKERIERQSTLIPETSSTSNS